MLFKKPLLAGIAAGFILLVFYFLILSLASGFSHAISEFARMKYWLLTLSAGFGSQVGLYSFARQLTASKNLKAANAGLATSGAVSAGSMVTCCAHHLIDVLPVLGISAFSLFLTKYQTSFIAIGILSNILGIIFILRFIIKIKRNEFKTNSN